MPHFQPDISRISGAPLRLDNTSSAGASWPKNPVQFDYAPEFYAAVFLIPMIQNESLAFLNS